MNHWSCTEKFYKKILTGAIFLLGPAANHGWYKPFLYWLHEITACCYFGVNLGKGLDHCSFFRLTDGTPHSSSDLIYFNHLLPFTWTNYSKSNSFSPLFAFSDKTFQSPNFSPLLSSDKNILSPTSILQKYSKTIPNSVLAAKSFQFYKNYPSPIFFLV